MNSAPPILTAAAVLEALHGLIDPEVAVNVVDLGMIADVTVSPFGEVSVSILPTTPGCPMHDVLADGARAIISRLPGVSAVDVGFVYSPPWTPDRITAAGREALQARN
ncbi:MAG TPA: metal-sulfur cluster assembly factor [Opitutaceae bacterium]|nr:metal-sulfur cluster assembly factor [Opitutaceae bacterium]